MDVTKKKINNFRIDKCLLNVLIWSFLIFLEVDVRPSCFRWLERYSIKIMFIMMQVYLNCKYTVNLCLHAYNNVYFSVCLPDNTNKESSVGVLMVIQQAIDVDP